MRPSDTVEISLLIQISEYVLRSSSARLQLRLLHQEFAVQLAHLASLGTRVPVETQNEDRVIQDVDAQKRHTHLFIDGEPSQLLRHEVGIVFHDLLYSRVPHARGNDHDQRTQNVFVQICQVGDLRHASVDDEFKLDSGENESKGEGESELGLVGFHAKGGEGERVDKVEDDEDVPVEIVRAARSFADARERGIRLGR